MADIDYILDAQALRDKCQHQDILSDYTLSEWEMLMRLRIGNVEVLGHTRENYESWMVNLERNKVSLKVPSEAWSLLSVLAIAVSVEDAFAHLRAEGHADIDSLDCVMRLTQRDDMVMAHVDPRLVGVAPYVELYAAFAAFAQRVRDDFLSICPQLRHHVTLGAWFRGEDSLSNDERQKSIIYLPADKDYTGQP